MKPEMGIPDIKTYEFTGPDESWKHEMTLFEEDVKLKRTPDAGLAEAHKALQIVAKIYQTSGY
jgi:hypothetical protein